MNLEDKIANLIIRAESLTTTGEIKCECRETYVRALKKGIYRLKSPLMLTWNLTRRCNLSCQYCVANAGKGWPESNSEMRSRIKNAIIETNPKYVSLLGGEPTLVDDFSDIILSLSEQNIFIDITTNGAKITSALIEALRSARKTGLSLMLSLDSYLKEINDRQRGKDSYDTVIQAAHILVQEGIPFSIGMTITGSNIHHLLRTYSFAEELGASAFCSWFVLPVGRASLKDVVIPDDEYIFQENSLLDCVESGGLPIARLDMSYASTGLLKKIQREHVTQDSAEAASLINCEGCRYRALIDANGDVYPCDFLQDEVFLLGNVLRDEWETIWNSAPARYLAYLSRKNKPKCCNCSVYGCDSGCFGISFAHYKRTGVLLPMCEVKQ